MAHVKNRPTVKTLTAVAACGLLTLAAACSSPGGSKPAATASGRPSGSATASSPATSAAPAVQLTPTQAKQAFDAFFPHYAALAKNHTAADVPQLTTGVQAQVMAFDAAKDLGLLVSPQLTERFYVPRVTSYPRWFAEVGTTKSGGAAGGDLFLMVQSQSGGPWQDAYLLSWTGSAPAQLSGLAVDGQGYATAVNAGQSSLVIPPGQLAAQYTKLLAGTAGAAAGSFASGDPTTAWASTQQQIIKGAPAQGWQVSFGYSGPANSVYALRTTTGGAVVFFSFGQTSNWVALNDTPKVSGGVIPFDGRMPINLAVDAGLSTPHIKTGTHFDSTYVFQPLAVDPPAGGKVSLMDRELDGGGLTSATMSG